MKRRTKRVRAEITVEAAFVFPVVLFLFAAVMQQGIKLYIETKETAETVLEETYDAVTDFRKQQVWEGLKQQGED